MKDHWENIYANKEDNQVSWFEEKPEGSVGLIQKYMPDKNAYVFDAGAGNSKLISFLQQDGYSNLGVLDISAQAIKRAKKNLSEESGVKFFVSSVTDFVSEKPIDLWHDRAVFHFLTSKDDQQLYKRRLLDNLASNAILIISTFSKNGPLKCSGLEICQNDEESLTELFSDQFELLESFTKDHTTPFDTQQNFIHSVWKKK